MSAQMPNLQGLMFLPWIKPSGILARSAEAWLVVVLAAIRLIVVISEALFSRYSATADDARLQVRDYGVDLVGGQLAGRWLKVIRRRIQWPPVTWMDGVCAILEGGHSRSGAATTDGRLQRLAIEFCRPQICSNRIIVVLLIAICEGTVAIGTSRGFPGPQAGADVAIVLRAWSAREQRSRKDQ
jgi:hypothetical protein